MAALGLFLAGLGLILVTAGVVNVSPVSVFKSVFTGGTVRPGPPTSSVNLAPYLEAFGAGLAAESIAHNLLAVPPGGGGEGPPEEGKPTETPPEGGAPPAEGAPSAEPVPEASSPSILGRIGDAIKGALAFIVTVLGRKGLPEVPGGGKGIPEVPGGGKGIPEIPEVGG
jgi:hypothetical protein